MRTGFARRYRSALIRRAAPRSLESKALRSSTTQPSATWHRLTTGARVSEPHEPAELQATRIADAVVRGESVPTPDVRARDTTLQPMRSARQDGQDRHETDTRVQGKHERDASEAMPQDSVHLAATEEPGRPLPAALRSELELRLEHDLTDVRVHMDDRAAASPRALDARAYTLGSDSVFGAGQYHPESAEGRRLLAHELVHVAKQRAAPSGVVQRAGWSDAAPGSTNVGQTTVGKMLRIPIGGLKEGNQGTDPSPAAKELAADSATAGANGRAIVIVPQSMTSPPDKVEVLLHLHGHNVGYRARKTQGSESGMDKGALGCCGLRRGVERRRAPLRPGKPRRRYP